MANQSCPRCGTEALPEYKFCLKCGAPLSGGDADASGGSATSKARLILIKGEGGDTASYTLGGREHICGRTNGIVLFPDDETVSPQHSNFFYQEGRLYLKDMGSLNGTYFRVTEPIFLREGDMFITGEEVLIFHDGLGNVPQEKDKEGTTFFGTPTGGSYFILQQILSGGKPGAVYNARKTTVTIGRESCDFSFPDDRFMSHRHATVEYKGDKVVLSDAGSRNGTFFRLRPGEEKALQDGDFLFIGRQLLRVSL